MKSSADWRDALASLNVPDGTDSEPQKAPEPIAEAKPLLRIELDRKRAGKTATIISGFAPDDSRADELAAMLKRRLAVGGSSRGGEILLQGDRIDKAAQTLKELGYKLKIVR